LEKDAQPFYCPPAAGAAPPMRAKACWSARFGARRRVSYSALINAQVQMSTSAVAAESGPRHGWRDVLASFRKPRVLAMLALGFSAGLPFMLTGNTLGAWLRDEGTELAAIGFLSWVGL